MISVTILTKNSEKHLDNVLQALVHFDEVLIGDTGSIDRTLEIASQYKNVKIVVLPFEGFGKTHNHLAAHARSDWIFSLDSDELPEEALLEEIGKLNLNENEVYSISRKNFYKNTWVQSCGWYPDRVLRIYNRKRTHFSAHEVHESIITDGFHVKELQNHLRHFPYEKISDFLDKMQFYTDLFAKQNRGKRRSGYWSALWHAKWAFLKSYFLKGGILQGGIGFEISVYNSVTAFYKYLKLLESESA